ncbi:MAG: hypothetical protein JWQ61_151 [Collimonas fungivorans]|nr:hypothetical protein [Collimonas fungivorans]
MQADAAADNSDSSKKMGYYIIIAVRQLIL